MSGPIGYVETLREDLLDAAWRSTMSAPMRALRRRPSLRWVIAGATTLTLVAAGGVGWLALSNGTQPERLSGVEQRSRGYLPGSVAMPSPGSTSNGNQGFDAWKAATQAGHPSTNLALENSLGQARAATDALAPAGDLSKIVKTARLSIVVGRDTFGDRFGGIGDIADRLGGYVQSSTTSGGRSGYVTMRVPASRFQEALRSLRGLGQVDSESVFGRDVTAQYVDLSARLRIALARRRVLFGLMDKAVSIEQTIRVQNALDEVQLRIEELQGEINVLNDRVSQATIRVSMREAGVKVAARSNAKNPSIPGALDRAVAGFFSVIAGVIVGLGWVLPALAVLAALWFVVTRVRRRFA
jgi:hypothetical protein